MLGYCNLLSKPSKQMNTVWEPIIKKAREKNCNMSKGKKSYLIVVSSNSLVDGDIRFISAKNSL